MLRMFVSTALGMGQRRCISPPPPANASLSPLPPKPVPQGQSFVIRMPPPPAARIATPDLLTPRCLIAPHFRALRTHWINTYRCGLPSGRHHVPGPGASWMVPCRHPRLVRDQAARRAGGGLHTGTLCRPHLRTGPARVMIRHIRATDPTPSSTRASVPRSGPGLRLQFQAVLCGGSDARGPGLFLGGGVLERLTTTRGTPPSNTCVGGVHSLLRVSPRRGSLSVSQRRTYPEKPLPPALDPFPGPPLSN